MSHVPGYSSARPFPAHQQPVRSPYGTPSHPLTPKRAPLPRLSACSRLVLVPRWGSAPSPIFG